MKDQNQARHHGATKPTRSQAEISGGYFLTLFRPQNCRLLKRISSEDNYTLAVINEREGVSVCEIPLTLEQCEAMENANLAGHHLDEVIRFQLILPPQEPTPGNDHSPANHSPQVLPVAADNAVCLAIHSEKQGTLAQVNLSGAQLQTVLEYAQASKPNALEEVLQDALARITRPLKEAA